MYQSKADQKITEFTNLVSMMRTGCIPFYFRCTSVPVCDGHCDLLFCRLVLNTHPRKEIKYEKILLGLIGLVMLSSEFALRTCWTSGDLAEAAAKEASAGTNNQFHMDLTGPWQLDNEKNILAAFPNSFPAYAEFGASMEIKDDGKISWYIGAEGGAGAYTQGGNTLTADIVTDVGQQEVTVLFHMISNGEATQLEMEYNGTTVYWVYGDSEEAFN